MALSWQSVDAVTGLINTDLPTLQAGGPCKVTIGAYETLTVTVPLPQAVVDFAQTGRGLVPPTATLAQLWDWRSATIPGQSTLIAIDEYDQPIWGGLILQRSTDHSHVAQLSLATAEAYLLRRYCGDRNYVTQPQNDIVTDLIGAFIANGVLPGLPIRVAASGAATVRSLKSADVDDKTISAVLTELMSMTGGPEFTIGWERQHAPERITPVLYVSDRLGTPVAAGMGAAASFSLPGNVTTATFVEDYTSGKGANRIQATSGQGTGRKTSGNIDAAFGGRPLFEQRFSPSDQNSDQAGLISHAQRALAIVGDGSKAVALSAAINDPDKPVPVLGRDWFLGDDVGYDLFGPAWIDGILADGVGRCIAWERDNVTATPILAVPDIAAA